MSIQAQEEDEELIVCPVVTNLDFSTTIEIEDPNVAREWNELSGLAVSPTQASPSGHSILWGHNDGRDRGDFGTNLAAWDPVTGKRLMTFQLEFNVTSNPPVYNQDWEDMTIGSCGNTGPSETCLYIADTGDNRASTVVGATTRPEDRPYRLYKIREPVWSDYIQTKATNLNLHVKLDTNKFVTSLTLDYSHPTSPSDTVNSEAIFLDHVGWGNGAQVGDLYIVAKSRVNAGVYHVPASAWPTGNNKEAHYSPSRVKGDYEEGAIAKYMFTSADMSLDGTKIILGTIYKNYMFLRCPGQAIGESIIGTEACLEWTNPEEAAGKNNQFESVAWYTDQSTVLNIAEALDVTPKLVHVSLSYNDPNPPDYCPSVMYTVSFNDQVVCQTVPNDYSTEPFIPEIMPDSWCEASMAYYGTTHPTSAPSTASPTSKPSVSLSPTSDNDDAASSSNRATAMTAMRSAFLLLLCQISFFFN
jgi:hypothetical protein